jgi:hypothetical protein
VDLRMGNTAWETPRPDARGSFGTPILWRNDGIDEVITPGSLRLKGYALKTGLEDWLVQGTAPFACTTPVVGDGLLGGEERLLEVAINGKIPLGVAMDIAKADTVEVQRELLKAYESKQLNQVSIRTVKRLIEQRRFLGKDRSTNHPLKRARTISVDGLVNAYRRESQRQRQIIKKARICDARLVFIMTAFGKRPAKD